MENSEIKKVCIYCASSNLASEEYRQAAIELGKILAQNKITIVYGGGSRGLMGCLANSALEHSGKVIGIMPEFMVEQEWAHKGITELTIVKTMHERKAEMIKGTDAIIALPGGTGTLEELLEVITLKRLGIYLNPILLVNTCGFYDHLNELFERMIKDKFLNSVHGGITTRVNDPVQVIKAIQDTPKWGSDALDYAAV